MKELILIALAKRFSNDADLGKEIRKIANKIEKYYETDREAYSSEADRRGSEN
mgnify:FL=1